MPKTLTLTELPALKGQELAVSDWMLIDQTRINQFADATGDHQWIHVDPERSKKESPFAATIAHGYLTLSIIPVFMSGTMVYGDIKMAINYGANRVRFMTPVKVGSSLRARFTLMEVDHIEGGLQLNWQVTMDIKGQENQPAWPKCLRGFMRNFRRPSNSVQTCTRR